MLELQFFPVVHMPFDPHGSEVWKAILVSQVQCFSKVAQTVQVPQVQVVESTVERCDAEAVQFPMAQKIGNAMKFFKMQFINRPSMCFSCRPCRFLRKNSSMSGNELRLLSTQGTLRITIAKIAGKESRELVCTTGARLSSWPLGTKRHFSARRSCGNSGS